SSLEIARQFESSVVKVISQENQGQSAAENRALREGKGKFIQFLDADDLLAADKLEKQVNLLGDASEDVASGEWARFIHSPAEAQFIPEPVWADMLPVDWLVCSYEGGGMMPLHSWLTPRRIIDRVGFWDESLAGAINIDAHYFSRALLA